MQILNCYDNCTKSYIKCITHVKNINVNVAQKVNFSKKVTLGKAYKAQNVNLKVNLILNKINTLLSKMTINGIAMQYNETICHVLLLKYCI